MNVENIDIANIIREDGIYSNQNLLTNIKVEYINI